jgi:hypothetical protein
MTRARDVSRLVTTPSSAYDEFEEVFVGSASPTNKKIWINTSTASAPTINAIVNSTWFGSSIYNVNSLLVDFLVIGGGGGGGSTQAGGNQSSGGGGAGGYRTSTGVSGGNSSAENQVALTLGQNFTVTVGAGGTGLTYPVSGGITAGNGTNSTFSNIISLGGGGGATVGTTGASGGSGGGGGAGAFGGNGSGGQGFSGGSGNYNAQGGGGGGAGEAGNTDGNGHGGDGLSNSITGSAVTRGGGGAGSNSGTVGDGTGVNTGGGGAGNYTGTGGNGNAGVVILRYPSYATLNIGAGLTSSTQTVASNKVTTFTAGSDSVSVVI